MASFEEIRDERIAKLEKMREGGIDPYPTVVDNKAVLGRVMAIRVHGRSIFADVFNGEETKQVYFKKNELGDESFNEVSEYLDIGDFVEVSGEPFTTKTGEESIRVSRWRIIAKSLRPLPEKWHGLRDVEERYRRRYLDILMNENVRDMVYKKSIFWNSFREYLLDKKFIEVETPVLENVTGGADARPFITHHNALGIDVYLRISAGELWQKELMVAGIPKTFEIARIFRNEGISPEHLQDYTQLEFYEAYRDYGHGMEMIKDLYRYVAEKTFGTQKFEVNGFGIDMSEEWKMYDYVGILKNKFNIDILDARADDIKSKISEYGIAHDDKEINKERGTDLLWKEARKELSGPGFLTGVPVYMEPLAKKRRDDPRLVERFQVMLGGSEMGKGFSELNDPIDQRERFEHQRALREGGDEEAHMFNEEFIEAMEYGMPPTFGFGVSERLFSFLMGKPIREIQLFPLLRPRK